MDPVTVFSAITAASAVGHLAKETIVNFDETQHERGPEHEGFREEHKAMGVAIGVLGLAGIGTMAVMYWLHEKNEEQHGFLQEQLDALFNVEEQEHGRSFRPTGPDKINAHGLTFKEWLKKAGVSEKGYVPGLKSSAEWEAWVLGEDPKHYAAVGLPSSSHRGLPVFVRKSGAFGAFKLVTDSLEHLAKSYNGDVQGVTGSEMSVHFPYYTGDKDEQRKAIEKASLFMHDVRKLGLRAGFHQGLPHDEIWVVIKST